MQAIESSYLSGRVLKRVLPSFDAAPAQGAPPLKRLRLPQGELAQIHAGDLAIHYIAYIELRAATERGNHFHKRKREFVYVLQGEAIFVVEDVESKERAQFPVQVGDLVTISPEIGHVIRVNKAGMAMEFSAEQYDSSDVYRYPMSGVG